MDENDPTFNNPALDLEDSDDDAEWNPLKDAEKSGKKRKHGHESSDEDEEDYSEFNNLHNFNKKRQQEAKRRRESSSDNHVPDSGEDFKVECLQKRKQFLIETNKKPMIFQLRPIKKSIF